MRTIYLDIKKYKKHSPEYYKKLAEFIISKQPYTNGTYKEEFDKQFIETTPTN
ncbi:MAG: hypothetical protein ACHQII_06225 [Bacteroidia bacterium]